MIRKYIPTITNCAKLYKENLMGQNLLVISVDKKQTVYEIELVFYKGNYLHLTGVKTELKPDEFFDRCVEGKISEGDVSLREDGTTVQKLSVLPALMKKNISANITGDYLDTGINLFTGKMVGNVRGCMGFVKDLKTGLFVPNTVLEDDIRKRITNQKRIVAMYRKKQIEEKYDEIVYIAKNVDLSEYAIHDPYAYLNTSGNDAPCTHPIQ